MSQTSHISRYRPAVIAVTGVAAAVGIWTLYSTFADRTAKEPLHRSNAVRRSRRLSADEPAVETTIPNHEEPFGSALIRRSNAQIGRIVFGRDRIPSSQEWRNLYGGNAEPARMLTAVMAVQSVLLACQRLTGADQDYPELIQDIRRLMSTLGLEGLADDYQADPRAAANTYRPQFIAMLGDSVEINLETLFAHFRNGLPYESQDIPGFGDNLAETEVDMLAGNNQEPAQGLKGLLYYIAEEKAKREAYEHRGIQCDGCGVSPIRGVRWHCLNCPDVDYCSTCEASSRHSQTHVFVKIKIPLPYLSQKGRAQEYPVWYPGDSRMIHDPIPPELRKSLAEEFRYEEPQIDALYDQFITTANVVHKDSDSLIKVGIDRRAFDSALTVRAWTVDSIPNALFDRMFSFYDREGKGVIIFEDFVSGISYLRGPQRLQSLKRAIQGFDFDGDGFVDRAGFLILLRAKYDVQKELIDSAHSIRLAKLSRDSADVIKSSQPISAIFNEDDMPAGELRDGHQGKRQNEFGDYTPVADTPTLLDDSNVPPGPGPHVGGVMHVRSLRQLQRQVTRLDHVLGRHQPAQQPEEGPSNEAQAEEESPGDEMTMEDAAVLGIGQKPGPENAVNQLTRQDVLWNYTEMSYNEILDSVFKEREELDRKVKNTADERQRWRTEIDEAAARQKELAENLRSGAELDPLVAAAAHSYDQTSRSWMTHRQENAQEDRDAEVRRGIDVQMRDNILPTDTPSLEQFEADIHEQSLEELLAAAGYSMADDSEQPPPGEAGAGDEAQNVDSATAEPSTVESDASLPHNRANKTPEESKPQDDASNSDAGQAQQNGLPPKPNGPPSRERLEYLGSLDKAQEQIEARGGPGRLSYEEVESLAASSREVRGLILSWLELAGF